MRSSDATPRTVRTRSRLPVDEEEEEELDVGVSSGVGLRSTGPSSKEQRWVLHGNVNLQSHGDMSLDPSADPAAYPSANISSSDSTRGLGRESRRMRRDGDDGNVKKQESVELESDDERQRRAVTLKPSSPRKASGGTAPSRGRTRTVQQRVDDDIEEIDHSNDIAVVTGRKLTTTTASRATKRGKKVVDSDADTEGDDDSPAPRRTASRGTRGTKRGRKA